jgi:hypothetical protein
MEQIFNYIDSIGVSAPTVFGLLIVILALAADKNSNLKNDKKWD